MLKLSAFHPVLQRFLAASGICAVLDACILEALSAAGLQTHLSRLVSLGLATAALLTVGRKFILEKSREIKTAKGQPVPFHVLALAGAVLNFAIFARILPLMPAPLDSFERLLALALGWSLSAGCNLALLHSLLPTGKKGRHQPFVSPRILARAMIWGLFILLAFASSSIIGQLHGINAFPHIKLPLEPGGPDAWLRLTQVRDWLSGANFFDHTVRHTNAPFGGISIHWTRPMDMVVALFYSLTPSHLPIDTRLMLAAAWLPAFLSLGTVALMGIAAGRHFRHAQGLGCVAILLLVSAYKYLSPGDADHHGLLTLLWCGVLALLLDNRLTIPKAIFMGALLGVMDWVTVESLALTGAVFALLGCESLFRPEKTRLLFFAGLAASVVLTLSLFVEMPVSEVFVRQSYDSPSIVHSVLLWLTVAGAGILELLFRLRVSFGARIFMAGIAGATVLLAEYLIYPKFFKGPLVDVDPFIFTGFLPRIGEAVSIFDAKPILIVHLLMIPALALYLLGIGLLQKNVREDKKRFLLLLSGLLGVTSALTFWSIRWGHYLHPVAMVAIAALLPGMATAAKGKTGQWLKEVPRPLRTYLALGCYYLALSLLLKAPAEKPGDQDFCAMQLRYVVQSQQLQPLMGDKELIFYASQDRGGEMQFFTPYRIIASNYHREGAGLHDLMKIETAKTAGEARPLLKARQVDALLLCPGTYDEGSWMRGLDKSKLPDWLTPVSGLHFIDVQGAKPLLLRVKK